MGARRGELPYRPYFDGLRCVAVYLVLAYHAGPSFLRHGFIGVDVFFVLSGYLVTRLLLRDLSILNRVDFRRFYARRVRRILPAASVVLVATALAYAVVATPLQMFDALGGFKAAFLYFANWFFIHQSVDYFATNVNASPVLQFWSLAVEEQFYLLWPLALAALCALTARAGRLRWWVLRAIIGAGAVMSVVEAVHIAATNPDRAYYGTDTRAYQLLAGALLALTPQLFRLGGALPRIAQWAAGFALGGLVLAATSIVDLGVITRGIVAVVLTTVLIVALENARGGFVKGALSIRPVTYLGIVSYGTYLWHWPIVIIATHDRTMSRVPLFVLTCTLATSLAAVSYHVLEHPIRMATWLNRYKVRVIAAGMTVSVVGGLVLSPAILDTAFGASAGARSGAESLRWRSALAREPLPDCLGKPVEKCTIRTGTGLRVVLMGDSHARMWIPALTAIAKMESWTLSVAALNECPWQRSLLYGGSNKDIRDNCKHHQDDWYTRVIPHLKPDIVFLAHQAYDDPNYHALFFFPRGFGNDTSPAVRRRISEATTTSIRGLEAQARKVVIIEPIPLTPKKFDPLNCLSSGSRPAKCEYRVTGRPSRLEQLYRSLDDHEHVWSLNLDRLVCPRLPICDPIVHNKIVKRDSAHLTLQFARFLAPAIDAELRRAGVLASPPTTKVRPRSSSGVGSS